MLDDNDDSLANIQASDIDLLVTGGGIGATDNDLEIYGAGEDQIQNTGFDIDPDRKERLLNGLDDIGISLQLEDKIATYENAHPQHATMYKPVDLTVTGTTFSHLPSGPATFYTVVAVDPRGALSPF